jgi:hypothetical protein
MSRADRKRERIREEEEKVEALNMKRIHREMNNDPTPPCQRCYDEHVKENGGPVHHWPLCVCESDSSDDNSNDSSQKNSDSKAPVPHLPASVSKRIIGPPVVFSKRSAQLPLQTTTPVHSSPSRSP